MISRKCVKCGVTSSTNAARFSSLLCWLCDNPFPETPEHTAAVVSEAVEAIVGLTPLQRGMVVSDLRMQICLDCGGPLPCYCANDE